MSGHQPPTAAQQQQQQAQYAAQVNKPRPRIAKRGIFQKDLAPMMYGFGDDNPAPDTINVMEDLLVEHIVDVCTQASRISSHRGKIKVDDFKFALRRDSKKLARVDELLFMTEVISRARGKEDFTQFADEADLAAGREQEAQNREKEKAEKAQAQAVAQAQAAKAPTQHITQAHARPPQAGWAGSIQGGDAATPKPKPKKKKKAPADAPAGEGSAEGEPKPKKKKKAKEAAPAASIPAGEAGAK